MFRVQTAHEGSVYEWLEQQDVPVVTSAGLYESRITALGVLDGGVTSTHAYGFGVLPSGLRVFGWQTRRLLVAELGLEPPKGPCPAKARSSMLSSSGAATDAQIRRTQTRTTGPRR